MQILTENCWSKIDFNDQGETSQYIFFENELVCVNNYVYCKKLFSWGNIFLDVSKKKGTHHRFQLFMWDQTMKSVFYDTIPGRTACGFFFLSESSLEQKVIAYFFSSLVLVLSRNIYFLCSILTHIACPFDSSTFFSFCLRFSIARRKKKRMVYSSFLSHAKTYCLHQLVYWK